MNPKAEILLAAAALIRAVHKMEVSGIGNVGYISAVHRLQRALGQTPRCSSCGCTDAKACPGGCSWTGASRCSECM